MYYELPLDLVQVEKLLEENFATFSLHHRVPLKKKVGFELNRKPKREPILSYFYCQLNLLFQVFNHTFFYFVMHFRIDSRRSQARWVQLISNAFFEIFAQSVLLNFN